MGLTYVTVALKAMPDTGQVYQAEFLVDTGAIDCVAPAKELEKIGVERAGNAAYELADGSRMNFDFGLVRIELMDRITAGRVVFGPDDADPILGVTALESAALRVNPAANKVEKMQVSLLK